MRVHLPSFLRPKRQQPAVLPRRRLRVLVCGGGELGTATAHRLLRAGVEVLVAERREPTALCRAVACAFAIYEGQVEVEGLRAARADGALQAEALLQERALPVLIEPTGEMIRHLAPGIVIDARSPKGAPPPWAEATSAALISLGPGSWAQPKAVVETRPGLLLGSVREAQEATLLPAEDRAPEQIVLARAQASGIFRAATSIGEAVEPGQLLGWVGRQEVPATAAGFVRGLLADGLRASEGQAVAEIYLGPEREACFRLLPWARAVAGGALEAVLALAGWP